jgi:hypothetical protein
MGDELIDLGDMRDIECTRRERCLFEAELTEGLKDIREDQERQYCRGYSFFRHKF